MKRFGIDGFDIYTNRNCPIVSGCLCYSHGSPFGFNYTSLVYNLFLGFSVVSFPLGQVA